MFLFIILLGELKSILQKKKTKTNKYTSLYWDAVFICSGDLNSESRRCLSFLWQFTVTKEFVEGRVDFGLRVTGEKSGSWRQAGGV